MGARVASLGELIHESSAETSAVFVALHGGAGEDGRLQAELERAGVAFTGPGSACCRRARIVRGYEICQDSQTSRKKIHCEKDQARIPPHLCRLCMDKAATGEALADLSAEGIFSAEKAVVPKSELESAASAEGAETLWKSLLERLRGGAGSGSCAGDGQEWICLKPLADGCSTGVVCLRNPTDLSLYAAAVAAHSPRLLLPRPRDALSERELRLETGAGADAAATDAAAATAGAEGETPSWLDMACPPPSCFLAEPFIRTDPVRIVRGPDDGEALSWLGATSRLIEITAGVVGSAGALRCLPPSVTVKAAGDILTLEEKFQGGTGVNLTPPPPSLVPPATVALAQRRLARAAEVLGIRGFARLDAFLDADSGEVVLIEANAVPGMSPSTVLFHQALAADPSVFPADFLIQALEEGFARRSEVAEISE